MCDNQNQFELSDPVTIAVYYFSQRVINNPSAAVIKSTIKKNIVRFLIIPNPQVNIQRVITFELPREVVMLTELLDIAQIKLNKKSKISHITDYVMNVDYIIENCTILLEPWANVEDTGTLLMDSSKNQDPSALGDEEELKDDDVLAVRLCTIGRIVEVDNIN